MGLKQKESDDQSLPFMSLEMSMLQPEWMYLHYIPTEDDTLTIQQTEPIMYSPTPQPQIQIHFHSRK